MLKKRPDLPYLYMTGYVGATTLDPSEQRVLEKPFTVVELAAKVEQVLFPAERAGKKQRCPDQIGDLQ